MTLRGVVELRDSVGIYVDRIDVVPVQAFGSHDIGWKSVVETRVHRGTSGANVADNVYSG